LLTAAFMPENFMILKQLVIDYNFYVYSHCLFDRIHH